MDRAEREYYNRRAPEYDDWYLDTGAFAARRRPGWKEEVDALTRTIEELPPARVLDVACGTGFLTRHLRGEVAGIDSSEAMLEISRKRIPAGRFLAADALSLPFPDNSFDRVFTGHFYGHLRRAQRETFLAEARRVAGELVVVDSALREDVEQEELQSRPLSDGTRHEVYKRYFTSEGLAKELGGGRVLHSSCWFVAVAA